MLSRYRRHPERTSVASNGSPLDAETIGVLARGDDHVLSVHDIGKETNLIEQQGEGVAMVDPQAEYVDPTDRDGWEAVRRELIRMPSPHVAALSGVSASMILDIRKGRRQPSRSERKSRRRSCAT